MFLTAMAANPLAAKLAAQMHIDVSWGEWALAAIVPGLTSSGVNSLDSLQGLSSGGQRDSGGQPTRQTKTGRDGKNAP